MSRAVLSILIASAIYGFAAGSVHSAQRATWNIAKFPLLILTTSAVCALAYYLFALTVTRSLDLLGVVRMALRAFADLSILLASLAPVVYFLALTLEHPTETNLNEYPMFLALNVSFIAVGGSVALVRQTVRLHNGHALPLTRSVAIVLIWLAISLFTGGQCAWYMRPFFGVSAIEDPQFMHGTRPDYRGATNFYEAVWHLVDPPVLPPDYVTAPSRR